MDEWQQQNPEPSMRVKWAGMLAENLEQIQEAHITGKIDRAEYEAQLTELDGKLGIIGFALANRPKQNRL